MVLKNLWTWKMTETLAKGYSSECTQRELSNEYQHDRVQMITLLEESSLGIRRVKYVDKYHICWNVLMVFSMKVDKKMKVFAWLPAERGSRGLLQSNSTGGCCEWHPPRRGSTCLVDAHIGKTLGHFYSVLVEAGSWSGLETGRPKLPIVNFLGRPIFKGDYNILRLQS